MCKAYRPDFCLGDLWLVSAAFKYRPNYLIPDLFIMTGLTEARGANFNLMRDLAEYTRQDPAKKITSLMKFSERMTKNSIDFSKLHML